MKAKFLVSAFFVAFFAAFPIASHAGSGNGAFNAYAAEHIAPKDKSVSASDEPVVVEKFTVYGRPAKGIVLEKCDGVPPYWEFVGYSNRSKGGSETLVIRKEGDWDLREIPESDFLVKPSKGKRFKLAQIDGAGKFLPVDLVERKEGEKTCDYWAIVSD